MTRKTRKRRKKLNEARLDVWGKHLSNDDNTKMSERIIELDMREELSTKEEKELSMLLKMEASLLSKSGEEVQKNKNVISEYYKCLDKISKEEKFKVLFNVRFGDAMSEELVKTPEDVKYLLQDPKMQDTIQLGVEKMLEHDSYEDSYPYPEGHVRQPHLMTKEIQKILLEGGYTGKV